jgi:hypothetical protein
MYQCELQQEGSFPSQDVFEHEILLALLEFERKNQFLHFLQKELDVSKTETEKEAILSILLRTKIQLRALERELQEAHDPIRVLKPMGTFIHPTPRLRRLQ